MLSDPVTRVSENWANHHHTERFCIFFFLPFSLMHCEGAKTNKSKVAYNVHGTSHPHCLKNDENKNDSQLEIKMKMKTSNFLFPFRLIIN